MHPTGGTHAVGPSRRSLLAATILGSGTLATGTALALGSDLAGPDQAAELSFPSPQLTPYVDQLPVLATVRGSGTLAMAPSRHRFHRDLGIAPTWSYGGQQYWGPTIEAHRDQPSALAFSNRLGRHLFAADVDPSLEGATEQDRAKPRVSVTPPGMDGHPSRSSSPAAQ